MIAPIKNKEQYEKYLAEAYELMQKELIADTQDSDKFELLSILIEQYEKEHFPDIPPHPVEAILFRIDQLGVKKSELKNLLGSRSRVSEILSGKRKLSLRMIRKLNRKLNIPAEILIQEY
ncbi:MAG TPA: helix-turn-helix domain-containing protein [Bacteroidetes bacterium]|nr:helix-turn-helix domain-containing protein [Bacteroidota bacterium]